MEHCSSRLFVSLYGEMAVMSEPSPKMSLLYLDKKNYQVRLFLNRLKFKIGWYASECFALNFAATAFRANFYFYFISWSYSFVLFLKKAAKTILFYNVINWLFSSWPTITNFSYHLGAKKLCLLLPSQRAKSNSWAQHNGNVDVISMQPGLFIMTSELVPN